MMKDKKERESNIELLRIICMFMVVLCHASSHGIALRFANLTSEVFTWKILVAKILSMGGGIANNTFVLISGYFMINSIKVNKKSIVKLLCDLFFYSWIIAVVFWSTGLETFLVTKAIQYLFPVWFGGNWFVCCYIILCLLVPFINSFFNNLEEKKYFQLLIILFILRYVLTALFAETYMDEGHCLEQFVYMYAVGGYIKLYGKERILKATRRWGLYIAVAVLMLCVLTATIWELANITGIEDLYNYTTHFSSLFGVIISVLLLIYAITRKKWYSSIVNVVASSTLGIYLIHDNELMRKFLWITIYPNLDMLDTNLFVVLLFVKVAIVFIGCLAIDQIRKLLLEARLNKFVDVFVSKIDRICEKWNKL